MSITNELNKTDLEKLNSNTIEEFTKMAGKSVENPFYLVTEDLERTKDFATKNIVSFDFG